MTEEQAAIFFEIHTDLEREGPGSRDATERAFRAIPNASAISRVVDAGCGPGAQTLQLAELTDAEIFAVDTHAPFLEVLRRQVDRRGLSHRVHAMNADMAQLPFEPASLDLIWSEGAIYNIGFRHGLELWRPLLAPGGVVVVSEATWLRPNPPAEIRDFWDAAYPAMTTRRANEAGVHDAGFELLDSFPLPEDAWWEGYYRPLERRIGELRRTYVDAPYALAVLDAEEEEIEMFRRYSSYYGYVFYVLRTR